MNRVKAAVALARISGAREALELLTREGSDRDVGRRALLLAYLIAPDLIGTQRDLAKRLGVTEGRASQMLKVLRRHFGSKPPGWLTRVKER